MTVLCLASYEKGHEFLRESKRQGCGVLLLTSLSLKDKARWPAKLGKHQRRKFPRHQL